MLPALLAVGGPGGVYPVKLTVYWFPLEAVQVYVCVPVNVLVTFELELEKLPPSLPVNHQGRQLVPEAMSVQHQTQFYAPLVVSVSGLVAGAVLDTPVGNHHVRTVGGVFGRFVGERHRAGAREVRGHKLTERA